MLCRYTPRPVRPRTLAFAAGSRHFLLPEPRSPCLAQNRSSYRAPGQVPICQVGRQCRTLSYMPPLSHSATTSAAPGLGQTAETEPVIHCLFEEKTGSFQYVVADPATLAAAIIDPVLDFDPAATELATKSADELLRLIETKGYKVERILETHIHADHITAAAYLQHALWQQHGQRPGITIGWRIKQVQDLFRERYGVPVDEVGGVYQHFVHDNEVFHIGTLPVTAIHLPGHTPDHMGYQVGGNVFCGDSLFHADLGTARCDFPGGSAKSLYASATRLLSFPDHVKIWTGHDYPPSNRAEPVPYSSVHDHKKGNIHLKNEMAEAEFVALREQRDATLKAPRLLHQSLQMNIRGGRLPNPSRFGHRMMHNPIHINGEEW